MTMSSNGQTLYKLRHLPSVTDEIKSIANDLALHGRKAEFLSAMTAVVAKLQKEPTVWGDPEYNLHHPGGCIYHGIMKPVIVKYAVFEHEKTVLLLNVRILAND